MTRSRARSTSALLLSFALLAGPAVTARAVRAPGAESLGEIGPLAIPVTSSVSSAAANAVRLADGLRPAQADIRVLLVSSGVDVWSLPPSLRGRVTTIGDPNLPVVSGDPTGLGTYAASVALQAAPAARIWSIPVMNDAGVARPDWIWFALRYAASNRANFDVVLLAFPPSSFLDPTSAAMATGEWERILDAGADDPLWDAQGRAAMGVPLAPDLLARKTGASGENFYAARRFAYIGSYWADARVQIKTITAGGLAVVAPAGDLGPRIQSVMGLSNLPEVVTVGAADVGAGNVGTVVPGSSPGPSIDQKIKPDLLAPAGVVGLFPPQSMLANSLRAQGRLDRSLAPEWDATDAPGTDARARLASSFASAAVVAAALGGVRAEGVANVAVARAALSALSKPAAGATPYQQGAGVLTQAPTKLTTQTVPLVLGHGDLGLEPDAGAWSVRLPVVNGPLLAGSATLPHYVGLDVALADGEPTVVNKVRTYSGAGARPISVTVATDAITISATPGDDVPGGLWCGGIPVSVPLTSTEREIPVCLTEGTRVRGSAFAIHKQWADHTTYGYFATLPPGASLLTKPLDMFHLNPLDMIGLFFGVTGDDEPVEENTGDAIIRNLPPGYYKIKQFADYSTPSQQTMQRRTGVTWNDATFALSNPGTIAYQSFKALILPPATRAECAAGYPGPKPGEPAFYPCDTALAKDTVGLGKDPVHEQTDDSEQQLFVWEASKWTYAIGPELPTRERFRLARGCDNPGIYDPEDDEDRRDLSGTTTCFKKPIGTTVSSRYIDHILARDPAVWNVDAARALTPETLLTSLENAALERAWSFAPDPNDDSKLDAVYDLARGLPSPDLGVVAYPFNLAVPNYSAHVSLNFAYRLRSSFILVLVRVGNEARWGVVAPNGTFSVYPSGTGAAFNLTEGAWSVLGDQTGEANFEFSFLPRGVEEGVVAFITVPAAAVEAAVGTLFSAPPLVSLSGMSLGVETWTPAEWPARVIRTVQQDATGAVSFLDRRGHSFSFDSRYGAERKGIRALYALHGRLFTEPQISATPEARAIDNGTVKAEVSEDWEMLIQSPGDHARLVELCDQDAGVEGHTGDATYCGGVRRIKGSKIGVGGKRITRAELHPATDLAGFPPEGQRARFYDPLDTANPVRVAKHPLLFACSLDDLWNAMGDLVPEIHVNSSFFETLKIPLRVLKDHRGRIEAHIEDIHHGRRLGPAVVGAPSLAGSLGEDTPMPGAPGHIPHTCGGDRDCTYVPGNPYPATRADLAPYVPFARAPIPAAWSGIEEPGWSMWTRLDGTATSAPAAASWGPGHLDVFVRGSDTPHQIWTRRYLRADDVWTWWTPLGAPAGSGIGAPAAAAPDIGRVDLFVSANGGVHRKSHADGAWGSAWQPLPVMCAGVNCTTVKSAPDADSWGRGRLDVVVAGNDDRIWHIASDNGVTWGPWSPLPAPAGMTGDPAVVSLGEGRLLLLANSGGSLAYQTYAGGAWSGTWESAGMPGSALKGAPDGAARLEELPGAGLRHIGEVFARGAGDELFANRWDGERWGGWRSVGGRLLDDPAVASTGRDRIDVVIRGQDWRVWHRTWTPDGNIVPIEQPPADFDTAGWYPWSELWGTAATSPDITSWGPGHVTEAVTGTDGQVWERTYWGGVWTGWRALGGSSSVTAAPSVASPSVGRVDAFSVGHGDKSLWRKTYIAGAWKPTWEPVGMPCGTGGCTSIKSGVDATSARDGRIDVVVVGNDARVWHIASADSTTWSAWSDVGAPAPGVFGDPSIANAGPGRLEIFVTGNDGEIYRRTFAAGAWGAWTRIPAPPGGSYHTPESVSTDHGATLDLFAAGRLGTLWRARHVDGVWGPWKLLDNQNAYGPAVMSWEPGRIDLAAARNPGRRLYHRAWIG